VFLRDEDGMIRGSSVALPPGATVTLTSLPGGYVEVLTDSQSDPVARLFVAPGGARVARSGERLLFAALVPGDCTVRAWHPRLPGSRIRVRLVAGATARVTALVGVDQLGNSRTTSTRWLRCTSRSDGRRNS
jgi:hypothetical protein